MFRRREGGFRGPSRRPSYDLPKPVEVGKEYDVEIAEVGSKGDGIARKDNFVIFVPNTKQGEKVRVKINSMGRSFAVGEKVGGAGAETEAAPAEEAGSLDEEETSEETAEEETEEDSDEA